MPVNGEIGRMSEIRKKEEVLQAGLCVVFLLVLYIAAHRGSEFFYGGIFTENVVEMSVWEDRKWDLPEDREENNGQNNFVFYENGYVRSATYFADEWSVNFWNSEMDSLKENMEQILADGFDSIILVVPWREFQPQTSPIVYQEYAFQKLDEVMQMAQTCGLGVYARIGYTWDYEQDVSGNVLDRFHRLLVDQSVRDAWMDYVQKMYETLSSYDCFREGFLTWEDFWPLLNICDDVSLQNRQKEAERIGFQDWVRNHYEREDFNEKYGTDYEDFASIPVPQRSEAAMEAMYAFFDEFLKKVLAVSQSVFPNISMEVRLDWDAVYQNDGSMVYYQHTDTFSCMDAGFTAVMYGIPMGFENVGERVGYQEAAEKTAHILEQLKLQNNGKPVYIEQFLFADNTPGFAHNAQIKEEELNDYLWNIADVLKEYSSGYGIWTYQNYYSNKLYNSQFALGVRGWEQQGNVSFIKEGTSMACHLKPKEAIRQEIPVTRNVSDTEEYTVEFDVVKLSVPGELCVKAGNTEHRIDIKQTGKISMKLPKTRIDELEILALDCEVSIDNVKLYTHVQQGYLYDENRQELRCIEGIRKLNQMLK